MEEILNKLKNIEPDKEFKRRSLALILNSPQNKYQPSLLEYSSNLFSPKIMLGITAVSAFLIISGLSFLNNQINTSLVSNLNPQELNKEIEKFNLQFSQIKYYEESVKKIEVALLETSGESPIMQNNEIDQALDELTL